MKRCFRKDCLAALVLPVLVSLFSAPGQGLVGGEEARHIIWQIGQEDGRVAEFALAPSGYRDYQSDPLYVVGVSDPGKDWPYVLPGPADVWAGGKEHQATVVFGLDSQPVGNVTLRINLANTHHNIPPVFEITLNGRRLFAERLPKGGPDATIYGDLSAARPHRIELSIAGDQFRAGSNVFTFTTREGSWVLFDCVSLMGPAAVRSVPLQDFTAVLSCRPLPALLQRDGQLKQAVEMKVLRAGDPTEIRVICEGGECWSGQIQQGHHDLLVPVSRVTEKRDLRLEVQSSGKTLFDGVIEIVPVREWVVYLLPHSHVDIGYTEVQTKIEEDHWQFYEQALETAAKTASYPREAQFRWNVEVLWAVDSYLKKATPEQRAAFVDAVKNGSIGLQALYGNQLTALCRPEELLRLVDYAARLRDDMGVTIDAAMISDVPGYTWGIITALSKAGVKYFSIGPNGGHRIGHTLRVWGDRAFWWVSPSGQERVLCWIPRLGYWRGFRGPDQLLAYLEDLEKTQYPFELVQIRHCLGDNAGPDVSISDFVKDWNEKFAYPRLVIATCSEMMHEFDRRYGASLPTVAGDFTPYWEDGAASSALETGLVRKAADRLCVAETLWALLKPAPYPDGQFYEAWRNVLLYNEHTWGAHNSITEPDSDFVKAQWTIKQSFALEADRQSQELLQASLAGRQLNQTSAKSIMVLNPCGWARSDLVRLAKPPRPIKAILDSAGNPVPLQILHDGQVVFLAENIPGFGGRRYKIEYAAEDASQVGQGLAPESLSSSRLVGSASFELEVDMNTGAITRLVDRGLQHDFVDRAKGWGLAEYLYVAGRDPANVQRVSGPARITVLDKGPLVVRVQVETEGPGCHGIQRIYELCDATRQVRVQMILNKQKVRTPEGVHIAFPFAVPDGQVRMELAWAVIRPEIDQLPGSCKNYFTVQRWIDVSNERLGVLWGCWEAPLVELGDIRVDVPKPFSPEGWLTTLEPTQTLLSYVMNNYWETNYKADQEGPTPFTYVIAPHAGGYNAVQTARFGMETTRPPLAVECDDQTPDLLPARLELSHPGALPAECKVARDGKGVIVRLYNPTAEVVTSELRLLNEWQSARVCRTDLSEQPGQPVGSEITLQPCEVLSLRLDWN